MESHHIESCFSIFQDWCSERDSMMATGVHDYSLMHALLKANDEVRLHSRFIYSMLNPQGLHYCGNMFLKVFLQQLPDHLKNFIDVENAKVWREKENIDLLIHDQHHFLIIENKLDAVDQKYQITRYIQYIKNNFMAEEQDISDRIAVVYLSKNRKQPSRESESHIGFTLSNAMLQWQGISSSIATLQTFVLPESSCLQYVYFSYFPMLQNWVDSCAAIAPPDGRRNAFEEYKLILNRLNPAKPWRKIVSLDQYVLQQSPEKQEEMYKLMVESRKSLVSFIALKIYSEMTNIFGEQIVGNHEDYKPFSVKSISDWLNKKGTASHWKNIGFCFLTSDGQRAGLVFAQDYVYFAIFGEDGYLWSGPDKEKNQVLGKPVRELLIENPKGLFLFLDDIKKRNLKMRVVEEWLSK